MGLVVANKYKGEIKSLADLKGRPVGVTSPGSQTHMVLGFLLAKSGVKADEVKIIGAGGNTMPLAIEKDSVHAGMMVDPFFTVFLKQGKGYALVDMFTTKGTLDAMGGEVQGTTLLTRPDVIAKRHRVWKNNRGRNSRYSSYMLTIFGNRFIIYKNLTVVNVAFFRPVPF
jgi:NitT/TauT family transport system substrate-binding protein